MRVAAELVLAEVVALAARIGIFRFQHSFLEADEAVDQLEHRSRGIRGLDGSVEHWLVRVIHYLAVVLADVGQHLHVYAGAGYHGKNLTGRRLYGHETADLVFHEHLAVLLEFGVDGGDDVLSWNGLLVFESVLVAGLSLVMGVAQIDVVAFLAAEILFPGGFDAGLAGIVARTVVLRMVPDV